MKMPVIVCLWGIATSVAVAALSVGNTETPPTVQSLSDVPWLISADADNAGRGQEWWTAPRPDAKYVRVPGILQESLPGYHGIVWYWREFIPLDNPFREGRCLLRFHAVDYLAQVWLNDMLIGSHEGGETPFTLDVTDAVKAGETNRLTVRVLNPTAEEIDGIVLAETPHRNKAAAGITVGGSYNSGGIIAPVEMFWVPAVHFEDIFVRPDWQIGRVRVQATLVNTYPTSAAARIAFSITPANENQRVAGVLLENTLVPGTNTLEAELQVNNHILWQLDTPYLYRLSARVSPADELNPEPQSHDYFVRFGFRDFRVEKGYFRLNGKRIFLKSSHTGNHCPVGAILPNEPVPGLQ